MNPVNLVQVPDPQSVIGTADALDDEQTSQHDELISQIITIEREYFFERRNAKTDRQRKLRELIERYTRNSENSDDTERD